MSWVHASYSLVFSLRVLKIWRIIIVSNADILYWIKVSLSCNLSSVLLFLLFSRYWPIFGVLQTSFFFVIKGLFSRNGSASAFSFFFYKKLCALLNTLIVFELKDTLSFFKEWYFWPSIRKGWKIPGNFCQPYLIISFWVTRCCDMYRRTFVMWSWFMRGIAHFPGLTELPRQEKHLASWNTWIDYVDLAG